MECEDRLHKFNFKLLNLSICKKYNVTSASFYLLDEGSHVECSEWRLFSWFNYHSVPATQSWCYLPREHQ